MRLLPKSIHWCRRYPTKFNSGRDIPWYKLSGYTKRSMVENAVYRYKAIGASAIKCW